MAFKRVPQKFSAKVNEVTIGTGEKAITLGGENTLPLYTFDAPAPHKVAVGIDPTATLAAFTASLTLSGSPGAERRAGPPAARGLAPLAMLVSCPVGCTT